MQCRNTRGNVGTTLRLRAQPPRAFTVAWGAGASSAQRTQACRTAFLRTQSRHNRGYTLPPLSSMGDGCDGDGGATLTSGGGDGE